MATITSLLFFVYKSTKNVRELMYLKMGWGGFKKKRGYDRNHCPF